MKQCYTDKNGYTFCEGDELVIDTEYADLVIVNLACEKPITEDTVFTLEKIRGRGSSGDMWITISHENIKMPLEWVKDAPLTLADFEDLPSITVDFGDCEVGFEEERGDEGREEFFYQVRDTLDDLVLEGFDNFQVTIESWRDGGKVLKKRVDTLYYDEETEDDE